MTPAPGIILIEPLDETTGIVVGKTTTRLLQGKVLATGINLITDFEAILEIDRYCQVGDIVAFLSYEGDYDWLKIDGKKLYFVKIQDLRGVING